MRIVHTADWHLVNRSSILIEEIDERFTKPVNIRLLDKLSAIHSIGKYTIDNAKVLIIAGDIYDNNNPGNDLKIIVSKFISALVKYKVHIIIIPGNHDENIWSDVSHLTIDSKYLHVVTKPKILLIDDVYFHCLPYRKYDIDEKIKMFHDKRLLQGEKNILIAHLMVKNCILSLDQGIIGNISSINESMLRGFDYVALGDIHYSQKIGNEKRVSKGNQIWYSGSIVRNSFSESSEEKYFNVIDLTDSVNVNRIKLDDREFYNLFLNWKEIITLQKILEKGVKIPICKKIINEGSIVKLNFDVKKTVWKLFDDTKFTSLFKKVYKVKYLKINFNYVDDNQLLKLNTMINSLSILKFVIDGDKLVGDNIKNEAKKIGSEIIKELE